MGLVIKNRNIFTASDSYKADIYVDNGKIALIACDIIPGDDDKVIDIKGLELYPGFIDVHTHLDMPFMGTSTADDFKSGSIAAACGGVTTIVDFIIPEKGKSLQEAVDLWHKKADGKTAIDYGFHIALVEYNEKISKEIPEIVKQGITSFKCFFAYKGSLMVSDDEFLQVLMDAKKYGAVVSLHAENGEVISYLTKKLLEDKKKAPKYHEVSRPQAIEAEAIHRGAVLSRLAGVPLYIVHLSSGEGLMEINALRSAGYSIYAETCPQYLLLSDDLYDSKGFEGAKWVMSPPLREKVNNDLLWYGIQRGEIQVVATDHCSFNYKTQKIAGKESFAMIPNGIPGIGDRVNLMYTYGVKKGKITRNQLAALLSANPAKIFGLYPEKGSIAVGADADFTVIDPKKKSVISVKNSHHNVDYNAFEGFKLDASVVMTISRGEVISEDDKYTGNLNHGKFIKRKKIS